MRRRTTEDQDFEVVTEREEVPERPPEPLLALQHSAGNQAVVRMLSRFKEKKGERGIKVKYAENPQEAETYCREQATALELDWDKDINASGRATILKYAQLFQDDKGQNAGLLMARQMILDEVNEKRKREERKARKDMIEADDSEYNELRSRIEGDDVLEAAIDWMKDDYIAGQRGKVNHTLGTKFTRAEVSTAVRDWRHEAGWVASNCKVIKGPHGYEVGPKDPQVGDTLDRRGDQGNIIATWDGAKINIHVDPSD